MCRYQPYTHPPVCLFVCRTLNFRYYCYRVVKFIKIYFIFYFYGENVLYSHKTYTIILHNIDSDGSDLGNTRL